MEENKKKDILNGLFSRVTPCARGNHLLHTYYISTRGNHFYFSPFSNYMCYKIDIKTDILHIIINYEDTLRESYKFI